MINETINKIRTAREVLARDLPSDHRVAAGHQMAKAQAKTDLKDLEAKLGQEVLTVAVPVFVNGAGATELATKIAGRTPAVVVDFDKVYRKAVDAVEPTISGLRVFSVSQYVLLMNTLRDMAVDYGLAGIERPNFEEPVIVPTREDLERVVVKYASKAVGGELAAALSKKEVVAAAVNLYEDGTPVFPVLLLNASSEYQNALAQTFKKPVNTTLIASKEVTDEEVEAALVTLNIKPKIEKTVTVVTKNTKKSKE